MAALSRHRAMVPIPEHTFAYSHYSLLPWLALLDLLASALPAPQNERSVGSLVISCLYT